MELTVDDREHPTPCGEGEVSVAVHGNERVVVLYTGNTTDRVVLSGNRRLRIEQLGERDFPDRSAHPGDGEGTQNEGREQDPQKACARERHRWEPQH